MTKKKMTPFLQALDPTSKMVERSIAFLRDYEPPEGWYLAFSGGKDSICTYQLAKMAGVRFQAYYSCTRIDPPEIYKFIRVNYPDVHWLYPKNTFWNFVRKHGPARIMYRWCCQQLKERLGNKIKLKNRLMGIRAEESPKRRARGEISEYRSQKHYKPIFHWKEYHVWEFIEENNFAYPSLYDEGFSRIGCVICPFIMGRKELEINKQRYPQMFRLFEKACMEWLASKPNDNKYDNTTFMERYYRNDRLHEPKKEVTDEKV
jgi:phosphoadenosine phosphosulfate reductase